MDCPPIDFYDRGQSVPDAIFTLTTALFQKRS